METEIIVYLYTAGVFALGAVVGWLVKPKRNNGWIK